MWMATTPGCRPKHTAPAVTTTQTAQRHLHLHRHQHGYEHQQQPEMQLLLLLHPFNGLFSSTTWVSRYQQGKTSVGFK